MWGGCRPVNLQIIALVQPGMAYETHAAKRHPWKDEQPLGVFSYLDSEQRVPHDHPLRQLRAMVDEASRHWQHRFSELWPRSVVHR